MLRAVSTGLTSSVAGTSATVSWNSVTSALKYDLRRRVQGTNTWTYTYNIYSTTRTINNLTQSTIYEWEVRTQCNSGSASSWSSTETFTISGPCTTPQNPDEQNLTNNSVDLVWDPVVGAVNYKMKWRKLGSGVNVQFINTNLLSLTGLDPASTYKWKVRSECDATSSNVSSFTSWQFFTTLSSIRISSGDAELVKNLNIYPNPTRGLFNISFVSDDVVTLELLVLDAYGKVIMIENKEMFVGEYTKQVDLSTYPKGIYMVQIRTSDSFVSKRIVVQ